MKYKHYIIDPFIDRAHKKMSLNSNSEFISCQLSASLKIKAQ